MVILNVVEGCQEKAGMQNELRRVVDALPGLLWSALPGGQMDFLNQCWCEYTGLSLEEASGWGWQAAVHPEDLPALLGRWRSILASGESGETPPLASEESMAEAMSAQLSDRESGKGTTFMPPARVVFLFDVDNTLLDNDRVTLDLKRSLEKEVGSERSARYWSIFESLRNELGYADYLGALQRYRIEYPYDSHLLMVSTYLVNYPFANRLYPNSLDVIEHCQQWGPVVILTDGDVVFQPRKIERSGLMEAVARNILIYIHKELELSDVERRYPAEHYVMVDDKLRILTAIKQAWGGRVTTVFPQQGHYALDQQIISSYPPADINIERIGDLLNYELSTLLGSTSSGT